MKKNKFYNVVILSFVAIGALIVTSCTYDESDALEGKGPSIIRMQVSPNDYDVNFSVAAFDAVKQTKAILTINRDAVDKEDLDKEISVTFAIDTKAMDVLNDSLDANDSKTFEVLPTSSYKWNVKGLTANTLTFAAGEAVKEISIDLDPTDLDFSANYALPVKLSSPSNSYSVSTTFGYAVIQVIVKNKYDGKYSVDGTLVDATSSSITGSYPWDVQLLTNGASQVLLFDEQYSGDIYHLISSGGANSIYGNFGLVINFDDNNNVTSVSNYWTDPAPRSRTAELDPSGVNKWDPDTKTLKIKYWMNQGNVIGHRTSFDETFTFKGPR